MSLVGKTNFSGVCDFIFQRKVHMRTIATRPKRLPAFGLFAFLAVYPNVPTKKVLTDGWPAACLHIDLTQHTL